jgi:hypothetical protein
VTADEGRRLLSRAAAQAEESPFFVASALASYRELTDLDDAALAAFLGCTLPALARLALCRRPKGESGAFGEDVRQIAAYAGCSADQLARVLRAASTAETMGAGAPGSLLAARDRVADEPQQREKPAEPERPSHDSEIGP